MRYLAIDLGEKRTGLAVGDDVSQMVSPLKVLEIPQGNTLFDAVVASIRDTDSQAVVVGLPVNMDGSEGAAAQAARRFGEGLAMRCAVPLYFQDERLTSYAADQRMARSGRTHKQKKSLRDALAAAEILWDFLDAQA